MERASIRQRTCVLYSGRVQGVGFRYTTQSIARRYAVAGYVRNLPDGRVELVAEGEQQEVGGFLREVRDHFQRHIRDEKSDVQTAASGEFHSFEIRH
jgi:acylphosphatase